MIETGKLLNDAVKLIRTAATILNDNATAVTALRDPAQSLWNWLETRFAGDESAVELLQQIRPAPANPELAERLKHALEQHLAKDPDSRNQLVMQLAYLAYVIQHTSAATHNHMENNISTYGPIIQNFNGGVFNYIVNTFKHTPPKILTAFPTVHPDDLVGRKKDLAKLTALLAEKGKVVLVNGMGGIGKTSLAAAYVTQEFEKYKHIVWISNNSADIADDILQSRDLLQSLDLKTLTGDREENRGAVLHKLRSIDERPKLFVIDNADAEIERRLLQLPSQPNWHVLITSREEIAGTYLMPLDFLQPSDAVLLFKKHCSRIEDEDEVNQIVEAVDYHTLTIEILARTAQLQRTKLDELLSAIRNDVLANVKTAHSNQAKIERVRTYLETIFDFSGLSDNELWLLRQFVALPPEFQAYELLVELIEPEQSDRAEIFSELLENLAGKGWLLLDAERDSFKMHRVVREAIQAKLQITPQDIESLLTNVTRKLRVDQTRDNPVDKFAWIPYGEAIEAIVGYFEVQSVSLLINSLGWVLQDIGDYGRAKQMLVRVLKFAERNFGQDDPRTATCCSNLGVLLRELAEYVKAKEMHERALDCRVQHLGADHPTTAINYSNLGLVLQALGQNEKAKELFERDLAISLKHYGAGHPNTIKSYNNLGSVLQDIGQYVEAKELLERAQISAEKHFGAYHPTTAVSYSNLGLLLKELGDYGAAKDLIERTIASDAKNFGADHPTTVRNYSNLGTILNSMGDICGAKDYYERALATCEKIFNSEHPTTALISSNLGLVVQKLGDCMRAKELQERALASDEKNYGADHPRTAVSCFNLGSVLFELGDIIGTRKLFERVLAIEESVYGTAHPTTAMTYSYMASVLEKQKELGEALSLASKALSVFEDKLPAGHPHIEIAQRQVAQLQAQLEAQKQK